MYKVVILIGKSATGKDTMLKALMKYGEYKPIMSSTSRPMRDGEEQGREYNFITREEFEDKIKKDKFVEYRTYNTLVNGNSDTWYYGIEKTKLNGNYIVILDVDGTKEFVNHYGRDNCYILLISADDEKRKEMAKKRGSFDETEWNRRAKADDVDFSMQNIEDKLGGVDRVFINSYAYDLSVAAFPLIRKINDAFGRRDD